MHNFDSFGYLKNEIFEKFAINNFSLLRDNLFLRNIKYNNIEILKLISFLVRDKNWNNYSPEIIKTSSYKKDKKLHFEFDLKYGDVEQLEVKLLLLISSNSVKLIANGKFLTDFWTNRIGFNLLLPLDGVVNQQVIVSKSDHTTETITQLYRRKWMPIKRDPQKLLEKITSMMDIITLEKCPDASSCNRCNLYKSALDKSN